MSTELFEQNEQIYVGNSYESATANGRINRYVQANGYLEIANMFGTINEGDIIYGVSSGYSVRVNGFVLQRIEAPDYEFVDVIVLDTGEPVALDDHFTGLPTQDYKTTFLLTER